MSPEFGDWIRLERENERLRTDLAAAARYEVERNHYRSENSRLLADLAAERERNEQLGLFCVEIDNRSYFVCESVAQEVSRLRERIEQLEADLAAERERLEQQADVHTQIQMQFCRERDAALAAADAVLKGGDDAQTKGD